MKKLCLLCVCLIVFLVGCGQKAQVEGDTLVKTGKITKSVTIKLYDDNGKIWLDNSHFNVVNVRKSQEGVEYIEFVTTKSGKELLRDATTQNQGKVISLSAGEILLFSAFVPAPLEDGLFTIGQKTYDANYTFNLLTGVKNKTQGLKPPSYLKTKDEIKAAVLKDQNLSEKDVTDFEIELEFDEDWRGWEYDVEFEVGEIDYEFEINAVTGAIAKKLG